MKEPTFDEINIAAIRAHQDAAKPKQEEKQKPARKPAKKDEQVKEDEQAS